MRTLLKLIFIAIGTVFTLVVEAQVTPALLKQSDFSGISGSKNAEQVKKLYDRLGYQTIWIEEKNRASRNSLFNLLNLADDYGLNEKDYQYDLIQSLRNNQGKLNSTEDSIKADILLSEAAIHFFTELRSGNAAPQLGYNGLNYKAAPGDIIEKLAVYFSKGKPESAVPEFEPGFREYLATKNKLIQLLRITNEKEFKEMVITSNKPVNSNIPLLTKLYQLGILDSANTRISDIELKEKIKKADRLFNLPQNGTISKTLLQELNIPVSTRIKELKLALNTWRWLQHARQSQNIIVVNIPSATLLVYRNGNLEFESKIIVGKKSTPTPTLSSRITEVILYPYWMVPNKIATQELLPAIKRNIDYLAANNYQVLNREAKIMDPYKINWSDLSSLNFPYIIRQSTGCDNSLGIVKLNFYNPYGVFLHDTPGKNLFTRNKRYFSHGCMRVEKAIELAHLILKGNTIAIDTLEEKGCLLHQSPIVVPANDTMAVFVFYNTAWIDAGMNISFNEDVYNKLDAILKKSTGN